MMMIPLSDKPFILQKMVSASKWPLPKSENIQELCHAAHFGMGEATDQGFDIEMISKNFLKVKLNVINVEVLGILLGKR